MAVAQGLFKWDLEEISRALKLSPDDVKAYFTDGRRVSFLLERRISSEVVGGTMAPSEEAGYDILDPAGGKWEVRSLSKGGIYFCPSYMVGSGRQFEESGFLAKLEEVEGYVVSDIQKFPSIPYWKISSDTVLEWWHQGQLGSSSRISRDRALSLFRRM